MPFASGLPLVYYRVLYKKRGETITYTVTLHPEAGVIGWNKSIDDDYPGARLSLEDARALAFASGQAASWEQWPLLPAVKNGRVHSVDADLLVVPGMRLVEMAQLTQDLVHPELAIR